VTILLRGRNLVDPAPDGADDLALCRAQGSAQVRTCTVGNGLPAGMYTTATFQLSRATGFVFLAQIPRTFIFVALTAWAIAFGGLLRHLWRSLRLNDGRGRAISERDV
jgi:hypothetical protein